LKGIKSNVIADFICVNSKDIIITTNNIASPSDLQAIKKYVKNATYSEPNQVQSLRLLQSKSYLKIISVPYFLELTNMHIMPESIEKILKSNYIFNDIVLVSKPRIIKVSPKSDMTIIWIDIWDTQSGSKAKGLINQRFNIGSFIATIRSANMNSGVPQCKNCWKWDYSAGICRIQGTKCVKCNGPHQTTHHHEFAWCCKVNDKINPSRLETKKGQPYSHIFRCLNCKGEH